LSHPFSSSSQCLRHLFSSNLFQTPASDDYYTSDTPPLEFPLVDLLGGTADEISGTQLSVAPPVIQPTQEYRRAMMEDFHDSPQCAGKVLEAAALVEAEARAASLGAVTPQAPTGAGGGTSGSANPQAATGGGPTRRAQRLHRQPPKGGCPVGLRCSLSDNGPRAGGRKTQSPSTRPPHVPNPP
jgi:hypothetical protein